MHRNPINVFWSSAFTLLASAAMLLNDASFMATAQEKKGVPNPPPAAPRAMIVVHTKYANGGLDETHRNEAVSLAFELARCGYIVDLVTEQESHDAAKEQIVQHTQRFKNLPKKLNLTLARATDAKDIEKVIHTWIKLLDTERSPLALLVVSGHGFEREKLPHFRCVSDDENSDGVALASILGESARYPKGIPLAVIWNACRAEAQKPGEKVAPLVVKDKEGKPVELPPEPAPAQSSGSDAWLTDRKSAFHFKSVPTDKREPGGRQPAVLLTTSSGALAAAGNKQLNTVVGHLAAALRDKEQLDDFLKSLYPSRVNHPQLRLQEWFHYGVAKFQASFLVQSYDLREGDLVKMGAIVANRGANGLAAPKTRQDTVNLLNDFLAKDIGELDFDHLLDPAPGSLVVTHPGNKLAAPWAGARVGSEGGFDPAGKVLELEFVAERGPGTPTNAPNGLKFAFNPTHRFPKEMGQYYNFAIGRRSALNQDAAQTPGFVATFNQPSRVFLPLVPTTDGATKERLPLDSIGFATAGDLNVEPWPAKASVRVLRLNLIPKEHVPSHAAVGLAPQPSNLELFPDCWVWGNQSNREPFLTIQPSGKSLKLVPDKQAGNVSRTGGSLAPNRYVPKGYVLRLEIANSGTAEGELFVDLLREDQERRAQEKFLTRSSVKVPASTATFRKDLPLDKTGWVNYLSIATMSNGLELKRIALVKDPKAK